MIILVTGFEPFGAHAVNPSEGLAKAVDGRQVGACAVRSLVLPVHHASADARMAGALEELEPGAVVHLGLAAGRARIAVERVAINVMDYEIPDTRGLQPRGEACIAGGPEAYFSTLPVDAIVEALRGAGVPAYLSNTAGTYVCNRTLYGTLHALARSGRPTGAGLIHLPLLPAMVADGAADQASMDFPLMLRAVETALDAIAGAA